MPQTYGDGIGRVYKKIPTSETTTGRRQETVMKMVVGGYTVEVIARDSIIPEDPYLNLVRAAAFQIAKGGAFPVPPVTRNIKDFLIKTNLEA